jgi:CubicO group peptidase (beta-lactamase class C family)
VDSEVVGRRARRRTQALKKHGRFVCLVFVAWLFVGGPARASEDDLRARIEREVHARGIPAASVAVVGADGQRWAAGFGRADETSGRLAEATTRFRVASVSKIVIALSLLRLRAEGKLGLEDEVGARVSEVVGTNPWQAEAPVRLVHLMENTSGWDDFAPLEAARSGTTISLDEALAVRPRARDCRWRPGARYSYSNEGAAVAAKVVESVSGTTFEAFAKAQVFLPLGMPRATYFNPDEEGERIATSHAASGRILADRTPLFRAAAGLAVSAQDMVALLELFLTKGTTGEARYLPASDFDRMERAESSRAGRALPTAYGLFNQGLVDRGHVWRGHRGGIEGVQADFFYSREAHVGYFLVVSTDDERGFESLGAILRESLMPGQKESPPESSSRPRGQALSGFYVRENPRFEWQRARSELLELVFVRDDGDKLAAFAPFLPRVAGHYRRRLQKDARDELFVREGQSVPELVVLGESDDDDPRSVRLATLELSMRRVSWARAFATLGSFLLLAFVCVSIPLDAARAFFRRRAKPMEASHLRERTLERGRHAASLLALACVSVSVVLRTRVSAHVLGTPSALSVLAFVASGLLPAAVLVAVVVRVVERPRERPWISVVHCVVLLATVFVLAWFGWLGARLWH